MVWIVGWESVRWGLQAGNRGASLDGKIAQLEQELLNLTQQSAQRSAVDAAYLEIAATHSSEMTKEEIHDNLRREIFSLAKTTVKGKDGRPDRQIEALLRQIQKHAEGAAADLPEGRARILYLNVNLVLDFYAQEVGYRLERTEPVGTWLKHHAAEQRLGWVLTRPFEWGVPIEAWY